MNNNNNNNNNNNIANHHHHQNRLEEDTTDDEAQTVWKESQRLVQESQKERALREAQDCLDHLDGFLLDGFNLLGVVANPRAGMMMMIPQSSSSSSSSHHGPNQDSMQQQHHHHHHHRRSMSTASNNTTTSAAAATPTSTTGTPTTPSRTPVQTIGTPAGTNMRLQPPTTPTTTTAASSGVHEMTPTSSSQLQQQPQQQDGYDSYFADTVQSLEYTLAQVTEQIETLNMFLEELSRQYLGDDAGEAMFLEYYYSQQQQQQDDELLGHASIPPDLINLQLTELQAYLEQCGVLAHSFFAQNMATSEGLTMHQQQQQQQQRMDSSTSSLEDYAELPSVFSQQDFDLTDPTIFCNLMVQSMEDSTQETSSSQTQSQSQKQRSSSLYQPTSELVPLTSPDALAHHLDRVELALQEQVRQKAFAFFDETTRFHQLQTLIVGLLTQVQSIRQDLIVPLKQSCRNSADISVLDHQRQQLDGLNNVLDVAQELLSCKQSIAGLLSANDSVHAAEQLQYAQLLLSGKSSLTTTTMTTTTQSSSWEASVSSIGNNNNNNNNSNNNNSHKTPLLQLTALATCQDQLQQYQSLIVQNLSEELVEWLLNYKSFEPHHTITTAATTTTTITTTTNITTPTTNSMGTLPPPPSQQQQQQQQHSQQQQQQHSQQYQQLQEYLNSLQLCHAMDAASGLYHRRIQQLIRMTVRTTIAEFVAESGSGGSGGVVTSMTYPAFYSCLTLLLEEIQTILATAKTVHHVVGACSNQCTSSHNPRGPSPTQTTTTTTTTTLAVQEDGTEPPSILVRAVETHPTSSSDDSSSSSSWTWHAVTSASDLATKSVAELLRLRKEAHSLLTLAEMKQLWDTCFQFTLEVERLYSDPKARAVGLRSTLVGQAKSFLDRTHESNMAALVAALDSERWTQCEVRYFFFSFVFLFVCLFVCLFGIFPCWELRGICRIEIEMGVK